MAEARLQLGGFGQRTDQTRQQNNYKDSSLYNYPANWATLGDLAQWATDAARENRRAALIKRWTKRSRHGHE